MKAQNPYVNLIIQNLNTLSKDDRKIILEKFKHEIDSDNEVKNLNENLSELELDKYEFVHTKVVSTYLDVSVKSIHNCKNVFLISGIIDRKPRTGFRHYFKSGKLKTLKKYLRNNFISLSLLSKNLKQDPVFLKHFLNELN
jgi:hypothetical protein